MAAPPLQPASKPTRYQGVGLKMLSGRIPWTLLCVVLLSALVATGCGDDAEAGSGTKILHITSGRDPTGTFPRILRQCNESAGGKWKLEAVMVPPTVDAQREMFIRRLAGKDSTLDILGMDVIWTAEFSEAGWIWDLTDKIEPIKDQLVPAPLATVEYKGKYWAMPSNTNLAVLYYRKDIIKEPPTTWQQMAEMAKEAKKKHPDMAGFLWQANQYEGLTVDALEFIHSAGGKVLDESGKKSLLAEGDGTLKAFKFMRSLFETKVTPQSVGTFQEEESRQLFQSGKGIFLRNWPYVWPTSQKKGSPILGKVGVAELPAFEGGKQATVLGGLNWGISVYSKYPKEAWEAVQCVTSFEHQKLDTMKRLNLGVWEKLYTDPDVKKQIPFIGTLRAGLDNAHSRPTTPYYFDVTYAIAKYSHEVAVGTMDPETAVKRLDHDVQLAVEGKGEI